jgi:hypothetical protein
MRQHSCPFPRCICDEECRFINVWTGDHAGNHAFACGLGQACDFWCKSPPHSKENPSANIIVQSLLSTFYKVALHLNPTPVSTPYYTSFIYSSIIVALEKCRGSPSFALTVCPPPDWKGTKNNKGKEKSLAIGKGKLSIVFPPIAFVNIEAVFDSGDYSSPSPEPKTNTVPDNDSDRRLPSPGPVISPTRSFSWESVGSSPSSAGVGPMVGACMEQSNYVWLITYCFV